MADETADAFVGVPATANATPESVLLPAPVLLQPGDRIRITRPLFTALRVALSKNQDVVLVEYVRRGENGEIHLGLQREALT